MTGVAKLKSVLERHCDPDADIGLLRSAINCESVTGNEANFVKFLFARMRQLGIDVESAEFLPGRPNLWGRRVSEFAGPRLLFMGHTDTVHVDGWKERWAGTGREDPFSGALIDGAIWGRGSADLKAGICASLAALSLLDRANVKLRGEIGYAFVGDEESGQPGVGVSAGAKDYVYRVREGKIAKPDFAIYTEPTELSVYTAQMGFFIAELKVIGRSAYFGVPELGVDALKATHKILSAIWQHSETINRLGEHDLVGRSFALVTSIGGGGYIAVPGECAISIIRKLRPDEDLHGAVADFERIVRASVSDIDEIHVEFSYPAGRDHQYGGTAFEIDAGLPPVESLRKALAMSLDGKGSVGGAPYWSEASFLTNQLDCPAVYCGPGNIAHCHTVEERVDVAEYLASVTAFAIFIANFCGIADN